MEPANAWPFGAYPRVQPDAPCAHPSRNLRALANLRLEVTMTYGGWRRDGAVIYLTTTPKGSLPMSAKVPLRGRSFRAGSLLIACVFALAACNKGEGDAMAKGKDAKDKGPEAI